MTHTDHLRDLLSLASPPWLTAADLRRRDCTLYPQCAAVFATPDRAGWPWVCPEDCDEEGRRAAQSGADEEGSERRMR